MSSANASFHPVEPNEHLERLDTLPAGPDLTPAFWDVVNSEVQEQLATLEAEIYRKLDAIRAQSGNTKGAAFFLSSYRTFSMPGHPADPVVASVAFTSAGQGVTVEADVSGEHTGDMIVGFPSRTVPSSRKEILAAANAAARDLFGTADSIVAALQDVSRTFERC
jgi:hypothetical protein